MIRITYSEEQTALAERLRDDLAGALEPGPPLLIVLVSAASNADPLVQAELAQALWQPGSASCRYWRTERACRRLYAGSRRSISAALTIGSAYWNRQRAPRIRSAPCAAPTAARSRASRC